MATSQFSIINKLELLRKRHQITASSWRLFSCFSPELGGVWIFSFNLFFSVVEIFLSLLLGSVIFLAILQCSAIWVGGSQSSALWANVHITKTTLQPCTLETRSSAKLNPVQKTAVIVVKRNPLHLELGFGLSTLLLPLIFGGPS